MEERGGGPAIGTEMDGPYILSWTRTPDGPYRLPWQRAALGCELLAIPAAAAAVYYYCKRTLWAVVTEITHFPAGSLLITHVGSLVVDTIITVAIAKQDLTAKKLKCYFLVILSILSIFNDVY